MGAAATALRHQGAQRARHGARIPHSFAHPRGLPLCAATAAVLRRPRGAGRGVLPDGAAARPHPAPRPAGRHAPGPGAGARAVRPAGGRARRAARGGLPRRRAGGPGPSGRLRGTPAERLVGTLSRRPHGRRPRQRGANGLAGRPAPGGGGARDADPQRLQVRQRGAERGGRRLAHHRRARLGNGHHRRSADGPGR